MNAKDIVRFKQPLDLSEEDSLMVILEIRDKRAIVSDLRFSEWTIPPTNVYSTDDFEVVNTI